MIFLIFWSVFGIEAAGTDSIKVFGTDSYHPTRVFEQKYGSYRIKNKHRLYEAVSLRPPVTSKSTDIEQKQQIGWKRVNGKMGWSIQSKVNDQWVVSFISHSTVDNPIDADDWLYLPNGDQTEEMDKVYADHVTIVNGNVRKSDAVILGMLNNLPVQNNMLMIRGGQIRQPPISIGSSCDPGWHQYEDKKCFKVFHRISRKPFAKRECFNENSQILVIDSAKENKYFSELVRDAGLSSVWLGINDGITENVWVVDRIGYSKPEFRSEIVFSNFYENTLENFDLNSAYFELSENENPEGIWRTTSMESTGSNLHQFICQKEIGQTAGIANFGRK